MLNKYSKECLIYLNHGEELTYAQIGLLCDVSKHTVYSWFKKLGIKGKNNQIKTFKPLSKEIISCTAEKNRKYSVENYKGKSKLLNPEDFQNVQSELTFQCSCGNIFKRTFYTALNSKIDNVCNNCKSRYLSDLYNSSHYQKIIKTNSSERKKYNRSKQEKELFEYVKKLTNNKQLSIKHSFPFNGKNYDIFIPELKLFVEYNGLSFHSEMLYYVFETKTLQETKILHKERVIAAKPNRVFMVWEDDWKFKQEIVKKQLKFLICGADKRIYARKTKIKSITKNDADIFYENYHIQGKSNYSMSYALCDDLEIVACMSFKKCNESAVFELVRYCSKYHVIGGFSKILSFFIDKCSPIKIISFADLGIVDETNNVYVNNGWEEEKRLNPDYKYIVNGKKCHKFGFRHQQLKNKLKKYDSALTEYENCLNHKIYRIWDCGKIKYTFSLAKSSKYK